METEELRAENERLRHENVALRERLEAAERLIKELRERLNQNSRTSHWPSSRETGRKPKRTRPGSGRRAGGQVGHEGQTLRPSATPDVVEVCRPTMCQACAHPLAEGLPALQTQVRQVVDLPALQLVTTEYQAQTLCCEQCGHLTTAAFPPEATHPVQYGPRLKQLALYLHTEHFIPYQRTQQVLSDLVGAGVCVGSLQTFVAQAAGRVRPVVQQLKAAIQQSPVAHADETGFYIGGERHWLHSVSTDQFSYYAPHPRRGQTATDAIGLLPHYQGVLVHDNWAPYFKYTHMTHALCNAHHLRELTAIAENDQQPWATWMQHLLLAAKALVAETRAAGSSHLAPAVLARLETLYTAIVCAGLAANPLPPDPPPQAHPRRRRAKTKARNLVERFQRRQPEILRFAHDFRVPFDNNLAERDIRMMKVQQKVSGCFRAQAGAEDFCRLRSYTATLRKQGLSVWRGLGSLFGPNPLLPTFPPPPV